MKSIPLAETADATTRPASTNNDGAKLQIENPKPNQARSDFSVSDAGLGIRSVDPNVPDFSESRSRRLLELKLLHHYNTRTSQTLLASGTQLQQTLGSRWLLIWHLRMKLYCTQSSHCQPVTWLRLTLTTARRLWIRIGGILT
jgi:hypothetical protein